MINLHLGDSLAAMRAMDDNAYDLAIVDPPYGLGNKTYGGKDPKKTRNSQTKFAAHDWDNEIPPPEYFEQLRRISRNQIIWGGNYFDLPPTRCVIAWDKVQPWENMSQIELAWTSYSKPAKLWRFDNRYSGKIHPTQKPVQMYQWLLDTFANEGDRIIDTHLGSGSIAIACYNAGYALDAWEIDPEYHANAVARYTAHARQLKLF